MKGDLIMKYLETRFYDSGKAYARLFNVESEVTRELDSDKYDKYVDSVGSGGDYESLEEWIEELEIELDDIIPLVLDLDMGKCVDISDYV